MLITMTTKTHYNSNNYDDDDFDEDNDDEDNDDDVDDHDNEPLISVLIPSANSLNLQLNSVLIDDPRLLSHMNCSYLQTPLP